MATKTKRPRRKPTGRKAVPRQQKPAVVDPAEPLPAFTKTQLDGEVKTFIVTALAKSRTPLQIVGDVKDVYGLEISRQLVRTYNPEQCSEVAPQWVELFNAVRTKFRAEVDSIPIAHLSVRLQSLDSVRVLAERQGNGAMVLAACEQAAKEQGGVFTNRHKMELTGKDGEPIEVKTDDLRTKIAGRIAGVASRIGANPNHIGANGRGVGGA